MDDATQTRAADETPETIARRLFMLVMAGVVAYVAVVIALMSTAD